MGRLDGILNPDEKLLFRTCLQWLSVRTVALDVARVESLVVEQGVPGRLFRYGDVKVVGTGGTAEVFRGVKDLIGFRKAVNAAAERAPGRTSEA